MAILKRQLDPDEDVLVETIPHWMFVAKPAAATALVLAVLVAVAVTPHFLLSRWLGELPVVAAAIVLAIPALWLAFCVVRWRFTRLVLTSSRIIIRTGALSRQTMQVRLLRMNEVGFRQTIFERMLRTGQLLIETGGEDGVFTFPYARKPAVLQRVINHQLDVVQGNGRPGAGGVGGAVGGSQGGYAGPGSVPPGGYAAPAPAAGWNDARPTVGPDAPTDPGQRPAQGQAPSAVPAGGWQAAPVPGAPSAPPPEASPAPASGAPSIPDQILQLDGLRQRGLLSEDEFQAKKNELLDRM